MKPPPLFLVIVAGLIIGIAVDAWRFVVSATAPADIDVCDSSCVCRGERVVTAFPFLCDANWWRGEWLRVSRWAHVDHEDTAGGVCESHRLGWVSGWGERASEGIRLREGVEPGVYARGACRPIGAAVPLAWNCRELGTHKASRCEWRPMEFSRTGTVFVSNMCWSSSPGGCR